LAFQLTSNTWTGGKPLFGWTPSLLDNFKISHKVSRLSWLNGKGQRQATITLTHGDWAWIVAEFSDGDPEITDAKIVMVGPNNDTYTLAGSVVNAE
jgi:hypothetical protein